jgi:hypothetical protein
VPKHAWLIALQQSGTIVVLHGAIFFIAPQQIASEHFFMCLKSIIYVFLTQKHFKTIILKNCPFKV